MFILYIDGSGSVNNPDEDHFILAGVAVYERQIFHLIKSLDDLADSLGVGAGDQIELHGSPLNSGRTTPWRQMDRNRRLNIMGEALGVLLQASRNVRAFGVVVHKAARSPNDPVEYAFEEICNRFNLFLSRVFQSRGGKEEDKQKGLIVMDQSHYEEPLQALANQFRIRGTHKSRSLSILVPRVSCSLPIWWHLQCGENMSTWMAGSLTGSSHDLIVRVA